MTVLKIGTTVKEFFKNLNDNFFELSDKNKVLYTGSIDIPTDGATTITLLDDVTNYDGLIFVRETMDGALYMTPPALGTTYNVVNRTATLNPCTIGTTAFDAQVTATNKMWLGNNQHEYDFPLIKIIGVKL